MKMLLYVQCQASWLYTITDLQKPCCHSCANHTIHSAAADLAALPCCCVPCSFTSQNSPGGDNIAGATADKGMQACPTGTQNTGGITAVSMANCDKLVLGCYYLAPGPISADTIKRCDPGFYCDTNLVPITVNSTTVPAGVSGAGIGAGRLRCPTGSSSAEFAKAVTDCTILLPGYQYSGAGAIGITTIKTCDDDRYCPGAATITANVPSLGIACPEGTGVAKNADDEARGITTANGCTKLYAGYYYTGIGIDISRSTVQPCPANNFCHGHPQNPATISLGTPILPIGCPTGTKGDAGTQRTGLTADEDWRTANRPLLVATPASSAANGGETTNDCNRLVAGHFYDGSNVEPFITSSTIKVCEPGKFCSTEGLLIEKGDDTNPGNSGPADPGVNNCVTGVTSLAGAKSMNDCNIIQARYYYDGSGAISNSNIKDCPKKSYWCVSSHYAVAAAA